MFQQGSNKILLSFAARMGNEQISNKRLPAIREGNPVSH
jgi:hypothetical protein